MKQELAQDIALMRYSMISPLIVGLPDEYRSKEAYFRAASARGALHPNGFFIHPAPTSIKRWYQHYQKNRSEERRVGKECRSRWSPYH